RWPATGFDGKRRAKEAPAQRVVLPGADRGRDEAERGGYEQVDARHSRLERRAVLLPACRSARVLVLGDLEAALDLAPDVRSVQLWVLREQLAVDVCNLAHEVRAVARRRDVERMPPRKAGGGRLDSFTDQRIAVVQPGDADFDLFQRAELAWLEAGRERSQHASAAGDVARHRA